MGGADERNSACAAITRASCETGSEARRLTFFLLHQHSHPRLNRAVCLFSFRFCARLFCGEMSRVPVLAAERILERRARVRRAVLPCNAGGQMVPAPAREIEFRRQVWIPQPARLASVRRGA